MSASDHLSKQLFHGTDANLKEGDIIKPAKQKVLHDDQTLAFATNYYPEAHSYGYSRAKNNGALFGSVYEVEPLEGDTTIKKLHSMNNDTSKPVRSSEKGFRVKKHVGWV